MRLRALALLAIVLLGLTTIPVSARRAPITVVNSTTGGSANAAQAYSGVVDTTVGSVDAIVAVVGDYAGELSGQFADGGLNTYTQLTPAADAVCRATLYYKLAPTTSATHQWTLGVGSAGNQIYPSVSVVVLSGVAAFDAQATGAASSGTTVQVGSSLNPPANSIFVSGLCFYPTAAGAVSLDSGFATPTQTNAAIALNVGTAISWFEPAAGAKQPTWSGFTAANASTVMATFTATGGGATPPCQRQLLKVGCDVVDRRRH